MRVGLVALLLCMCGLPALAAPGVGACLPGGFSFCATWGPGGSAIVSWRGAPEGSCVYAVQPSGLRVRLEPCGRAQTVILPAGGVDLAYAPVGALPGRPGTVYVLYDERGQQQVATATLPGWQITLPIMYTAGP